MGEHSTAVLMFYFAPAMNFSSGESLVALLCKVLHSCLWCSQTAKRAEAVNAHVLTGRQIRMQNHRAGNRRDIAAREQHLCSQSTPIITHRMLSTKEYYSQRKRQYNKRCEIRWSAQIVSAPTPPRLRFVASHIQAR